MYAALPLQPLTLAVKPKEEFWLTTFVISVMPPQLYLVLCKSTKAIVVLEKVVVPRLSAVA